MLCWHFFKAHFVSKRLLILNQNPVCSLFLSHSSSPLQETLPSLFSLKIAVTQRKPNSHMVTYLSECFAEHSTWRALSDHVHLSHFCRSLSARHILQRTLIVKPWPNLLRRHFSWHIWIGCNRWLLCEQRL